MEGKHAAVGRSSQICCGGIGRGSDELIRGAGVPDRERTAGSNAEGDKNTIARGRALDERRASDAGDLRLWSRLNGWRAHRQIHLGETRGTGSRGTAFTAKTDENGLRAGGGDAGRTGICEAGDAADGHSCAGSQNRIEKINTLCAKIGDDELPAVGSQSQAAQSRVWRRTARGLERGRKIFCWRSKTST